MNNIPRRPTKKPDPKSRTEFAKLNDHDPVALARLERAIEKLGVNGAAELYGLHRATIWKLRNAQ